MCLCKYGGFGTGWSWKASLITACGRIEDLWSNKYWNCAQLSRTRTLPRFATSSPFYTRETILLQKQLKSSVQKFYIFVPIKAKSKPDILECMSQLASQQKSLPPCSSVLARWNTWKYADAGLSAGRVDRGQIWLLFFFLFFFLQLPLLRATNTDTEQEIEKKKGRGISTPSSPLPWAFIPGESQLTWVSKWWRVINKCIGLIIQR